VDGPAVERVASIPELSLKKCTAGGVEAAQVGLGSGVLATVWASGATDSGITLLGLTSERAVILQSQHGLRRAKGSQRRSGEGSHGRHVFDDSATGLIQNVLGLEHSVLLYLSVPGHFSRIYPVYDTVL
jgi:hypothetical protein